MMSDTKVISVRAYERKKQLAPKTWVVTTVKAYQRGRPMRQQQPVAQADAA